MEEHQDASYLNTDLRGVYTLRSRYKLPKAKRGAVFMEAAVQQKSCGINRFSR